MATYGPGTPAGFIPFTGFSPTLGVNDAIIPVTTGLVQMLGNTQNDNMLSKLFFRRGNRKSRALMLALLGSAVGGTATENFTRVQAVQGLTDPSQLGGRVAIETVAQINRATTSADLTQMVASMSRTYAPATYNADLSGNGGGGHTGF